MLSKNLRYYRLKNGLTKKELADKCNVTPMAVTHYEKGDRTPDMDTLKRLAEALQVQVSDFLAARNTNLVFQHGEFRKNASLTQTKQEYVRESVEEYFGRFYAAVEFLGGEVLPPVPECHALALTDSTEQDACALRKHLGLAADGPIVNLIKVLENKGILLYICDIDDRKFSGMNGFVCGRPYIIVNGNMTAERNRSTIVHELAHLFFRWPSGMNETSAEKAATAISGAFLFPQTDVIRELGVRRGSITNDMVLVCKEYGVSMMLLAKRAQICGVILDGPYQAFCRQASSWGWRTNEPSRIEPEIPLLFRQLVLRAVSEGHISIQKGAELLHTSYEDVASNSCRHEG